MILHNTKEFYTKFGDIYKAKGLHSLANLFYGWAENATETVDTKPCALIYYNT